MRGDFVRRARLWGVGHEAAEFTGAPIAYALLVLGVGLCEGGGAIAACNEKDVVSLGRGQRCENGVDAGVGDRARR